MAVVLNHNAKVNGTTIVEVTVALVIISVMLILAFATYGNILKSTRFRMKQKAMLIAHQADSETEDFTPVSEEKDGWTVEIEFVPYTEQALLWQKNISVRDPEGRPIYTIRKIIRKDEGDDDPKGAY